MLELKSISKIPPKIISNFLLICLAWHLIILELGSTVSAIRKDVSLQENRHCRTTVQGRYLLSDDNGHVCDALSVDPKSRCCPIRGEQFSCHGCNLVSQCCNSYEYCVSCCLNPARTQKDLVLKLKIAKPVSAGTYSSIFDYCAGRCRHNSESVVRLIFLLFLLLFRMVIYFELDMNMRSRVVIELEAAYAQHPSSVIEIAFSVFLHRTFLILVYAAQCGKAEFEAQAFHMFWKSLNNSSRY
ncbi:uncharacterized protein LOC113766344 [Coffea eugenioides]|uniref:uncharacterized protein LOC113766344 n=1 Tax=Coffea eugenioides TaxID=49369 RepID=UPI000F60482C|nr:uncharacterized protein LOC113766344 [Coffea eugenioides]